MNETQRNIQAYKAALPGLKERVLAVALLLVMSAVMMTSATFAWITLSRAPEVTNVSTTVAANGNLEIALATATGEQPAESAVGDSSAAEGNDLTKANVTWGNLVNLSDPSYGLDKIVLRPALLGNTNNLLQQPLKGVDYGKDGRLEQYYNENYQFTNWFTEPGGNGYFKFYENPQYGVRAISTVAYEYTNPAYYQFSLLMQEASRMQQYVDTAYAGDNGITNNRTYLDALAAMIGTFMTDNLNDGQDSDISSYMKDLYNLMVDVYELMVGSEENPDTPCFEDALVALANTMVYTKYTTEANPEAYVPYLYTWEKLSTATTTQLANDGIKLDCLDDYIKVKNGFKEVLYGTGKESGEYDENGQLIPKDDCIYDFYLRVYPQKTEDGKPDESRPNSSAKVAMSELEPYINRMVDIDTCTLNLKTGKSYQVNQIGMSVALDIMDELDNCNAVIKKGLLKDFETVTGARMCATNVKVKAKYIMTITATADTITTTAPDVSLFDEDVTYSEDLASENKSYNAIAQDTYGMALDFWVRTNTSGGHLILEGNVLTKEVQENEQGIDRNGALVDLYTATITTTVTDETGKETQLSSDVAVYKLNEDGKDVWYYADGHALLYNEDGTVPEGQTISTPIPRVITTYPVIGYEGENRIWQDNALIDVTSTTQGSGSCYVFYADDPGQQTNSLRLLSNLRVAFIDNTEGSATNGKMVAIGKLDVDNRYEENGKVTVPLVLFNDGSNYLTKTVDGLAILSMPQNEPIRLTAVIFLDGREITNADVLAADDIQGQLNIQFGSTAEMNPIDDETLQLATRSVSALIKKADAADYPTANNGPKFDEEGKLISDPDISFAFEEATADNPMKVKVKVKVDGERASNVVAFFMRKVNDTQGSREDDFTLHESETEQGIYEGEYTFTAPGEYVLRTVRLDGVDYSLPATDYPRVAISGYSIQDVQMYYNGERIESTRNIMTDAGSITTNLELKFATSQKRPNSIKLQFKKDDNTLVTTTLNYNSTDEKWLGSVAFASSGTYTLKFVIVDGEYEELDLRYQKKLELKLGLKVEIVDSGDRDYRNGLFLGETINVPMTVRIYDNNGDEIKYLKDVKLYYLRNNSIVGNQAPDVTWDASRGCYTSNVEISRPGKYAFYCVSVGENTITSTVGRAPTFNWASPVPPSYYDAAPMAEMDDYILSDGTKTETVGVRLLDAEGASVAPIFYDADTDTYYQPDPEDYVSPNKDEDVTVNGTKKTASTFIFELPATDGNYQCGDWTLAGLKLIDVYDTNSNAYDLENPMVWEFVSADQVQMVADDGWKAEAQKVQLDESLHVQIVKLKMLVACESNSVTEGGYVPLSGAFLETKTTPAPILITITDQMNRKLKVDVADVTLNYRLENGSSSTYGGYTAAHLQEQNVAGTNDTYSTNSSDAAYTIKVSEDGTTYTVESMKLLYAGIYYPHALSFTIGGKTINYTAQAKNIPAGIPSYKYTTVRPTATITGISPTGSNPSKITWTAKAYSGIGKGGTITTFTAEDNKESKFSSETNEAIVYALPTVDNSGAAGTELSNHNGSFTKPTVKLTVAGTGSSDAVSITLPANGNAPAVKFSRTGNGDMSGTLGHTASIKTWTHTRLFGAVTLTHTLYAYYGYGETTIKQMTVVREGKEYTVNLPKAITINNPSSVNKTA